MKKCAIVLAAGKGVRMNSDLPKVSHSILGKPMIVWVVETLNKLPLDGIYIVVGYKAEIVKKETAGFNVTYVTQKEQLGTGHAVAQAKPYIENGSLVIVLNGDVPFIKKETLENLMRAHESRGASATVLTVIADDPASYGRIIRADDGQVIKIVEKKDASEEEKLIKEVNTGTYCFNSTDLFSSLDELKPNNAQKEYYLTDIIEILRKKGKPIYAFKSESFKEVSGINTKDELIKLEEDARNVA
jgi:bifunctional UDP-N-acetylglucosamine pyrophosphorylase / glucosamine-1-phosphate N-acetyltransferase